MTTSFGYQLRACGSKALPPAISIANRHYTLVRVFKHDFFAATALYQYHPTQQPAKQTEIITPINTETFPNAETLPNTIVLKIARTSSLLGMPMLWLGQLLAKHELSILKHLEDIHAVPRILGTFGKVGFVYQYIEGLSLDEKPSLPDDFFEQLQSLVNKIHTHRVAYIDMNKKGNILIRPDGSPAMIDFQISFHIPQRLLGSRRLTSRLLKALQKEDFYHLLKHKRRLRPDLMTDQQIRQSRRVSPLIVLHRIIARPLTTMRRRGLAMIFRKGHITTDNENPRTPENDPNRWLK